ncbi:hypothetical protein [Sphingomonas sp.]|uniref:hypothetical protein n=1 Tax=Sphingomonas sp. TaxID=28214 RepID=UPI0035C7E1F6
MTRPRFLLGGTALALLLGAALVAMTGGGVQPGMRFTATALPTILPFVLGTLAPRGRRALWLVLAALVTAGWTSAALGLRAAVDGPSFAGLHGWLACAVAGAVALVVTTIGTVRHRTRARNRTAT